MSNELVINDKGELRVLIKALNELKFESGVNSTTLFYACSPHFASAYRKVYIAARGIDLDNYQNDPAHRIESHSHLYDMICEYLSSIDSWNEADSLQKVAIVEVLCSPFLASKDVVKRLIDYADTVHGKEQ